MARPINPAIRLRRRLQIVDAGLTAFAEFGYAGATTAKICRIAGIGSGTFFHHFPTKDSLLVAILDMGTEETREFFAAHDPEVEPRQILVDYVDHVVADLVDPRAAGFIDMVGGLTTRPEIATALEADSIATRDGLVVVAAAAQQRMQIRTDLAPDRIATWIILLVDGFAAQVAGGDFDVARESRLLAEQLDHLLDGPTSKQALHRTSA